MLLTNALVIIFLLHRSLYCLQHTHDKEYRYCMLRDAKLFNYCFANVLSKEKLVSYFNCCKDTVVFELLMCMLLLLWKHPGTCGININTKQS